MNYLKITKEYYSRWLDVEPELLDGKGIFLHATDERNTIQRGYNAIFDLYIYMTKNLCVISYSDKIKNRIKEIVPCLRCNITVNIVKQIINDNFDCNMNHHLKFVFESPNNDIKIDNVKQLNIGDYDLYYDFYRRHHNITSNQIDWLYDYFYDITNKGFSYGIMSDDKLVSVTDSPDMPYMESVTQDIGINTLNDYRKKGYAKSVTAATINNLIGNNMCPQWSCNHNNVASRRLAHSVGFALLADVVTVTLK